MTLPASPRIDCHIHAIDPIRFPYSDDTPYRPSGQEIAPAAQLIRVFDAFDVRHALVVATNTGYGSDSRILLDTLKQGEQGQVDFGSDVIKLKGAKADAVFVYTNEEESARFLIEAKRQGLSTPLFGETTLLSQKVVELAGSAANGVRGHVGLSADAPVPAIQEFAKKFSARYKYWPDHNGIKGYTAVYLVKHVTEKIGKFDSKAMKGLTLTPDEAPGILKEASWDQNGDIDRASFLAEIVDGKQTIVETLPKLKGGKSE
ncbi:ABC transporter substrate-binding protein [Bradyrhizobium sp. AS23.2]|uniref:ABC transporter substrate-binding protein n=1 Tax=Bradyrhizobium sp. AS23.2 TaxID=1680155 RepID=UPI0009F934B8|nr:ABC transporter substrate-binding protein [Bradyrhizobium sp. AS23.2]